MIYPAPSFLTGITTDLSNQTLSQIQENYGDNTSAFKLTAKFTGLVQTWIDEFKEHGGTIWGIDSKGTRTIIFDQSKHGYNGLMQLNPEENLNSTKSIDLPKGTEIVIAFQYGGDEADYLNDGSSKYEQDYFTWVIIYKYLDNKLEEVFTYECA